MGYNYSPSVGMQCVEVAMGKYIDRGDPTIVDFNKASFTLDDAWHDLDLSGIVAPAGAGHLVHLIVEKMSNAGDVKIQFRKNGNVNTINMGTAYLYSTGFQVKSDVWVMMDVNRIVEYKGSLAAKWDTLYVTVRGWIED